MADSCVAGYHADEMRVLLVEDEPSAAQVLAKGLREQSYAVDLAAEERRLRCVPHDS